MLTLTPNYSLWYVQYVLALIQVNFREQYAEFVLFKLVVVLNTRSCMHVPPLHESTRKCQCHASMMRMHLEY